MGPRTRRDQLNEITGRNRTVPEMQAESDVFLRDLSRATSAASLAATAVNPAVGMMLGAAGSSVDPDKQPPSPVEMGLMAGMMTAGGGVRPSRIAYSPEELAAMRSVQAGENWVKGLKDWTAAKMKYGPVHQKVMATARNTPRRVAAPEGPSYAFNDGVLPKGAVRVNLQKPTAFREGWGFDSPQVQDLLEKATAGGAKLRAAEEARSKTLAARFKRWTPRAVGGILGGGVVYLNLPGEQRSDAEASEKAREDRKDSLKRAAAAMQLRAVLDDPAIGSAEAMARALATPESYGQYLEAVRSAFASNYVDAANRKTAKDLRKDVVGGVSELESRLLRTNAGAVRYYNEMMQVKRIKHPLRDGLREDMDDYDMKKLELPGARLEELEGGPYAK